MKTDCLILGCGYLGLRVARRWIAQGQRVAALTRSQERAAAFQTEGILPILGDVLDRQSLEQLPVTPVLLSAVGHDRASGTTMEAVTQHGLAHLLEALSRRWSPAPCHCIYVSSTSVYGQTDGSWVTESAPCEPLTASGRTILAAERQLQAAARTLPGLTATILRFAGIYGPGRLLREQALRQNEPIATAPEGWLNLIHVDDGADIVAAVAEHPEKAGVYNVVDDEPVRRGEFYTFLSQQLATAPPRFVPPLPQAIPGHDAAHRRIANNKLKEAYGVTLRYPHYRAGLAAAM